MNRIITVKGTGSVSIKPDLIVITMEIESRHKEYEKTMQLASQSIASLQEAVQAVGFKQSDLKTTSFNVGTHYENYTDENNNYKSKFVGYLCEQALKLEFDFDTAVLEKILLAIVKTSVNPKLDIQFSIKDQAAVNEQLLINATENARTKAEILANASKVELGDLVTIDYNWSDLHLYSPTRYDMENKLMSMSIMQTPDIQPDDINVSDSVTFVWEIKQKFLDTLAKKEIDLIKEQSLLLHCFTYQSSTNKNLRV